MREPIFEIKTKKEGKERGVFIIEPLPAGFGITIGNALRRVLLTSLPGAAVTFVRIPGVRHQFSTIPGLKEDVVELVLNIKKLRVRYDGEKPVKIKLEATGPGEVKAEKIKAPAGVEVVNKDLVLGTLAGKRSKLSCEMTVEKGYGFSPFEERESATLGVIPIDASFSPVKKVNFEVELTRVGRITNFDRLILEVATDGSIKPREAVLKAAELLISYFAQIVSPKKPKKKKEEAKKEDLEVFKLSVQELSLPTRVANALEKGGYKTVASLLTSNKKELLEVKNLGTKSVKIIEAALAGKGVKLS